MNKGSCSNGSNNIHYNYPLIMDDARLFSNYYSSVFNDEMLKNNNNIM